MESMISSLVVFSSLMMAEGSSSLDLLNSCPVCFEHFEQDGDYLPRLLPCTHTVCESCIKQLILNKKLECPECRTKHEAKNKEKSFPQNKYLLTQIKRKSTEVTDEKPQEEFGTCEEHGKDLIFFCKEEGCQESNLQVLFNEASQEAQLCGNRGNKEGNFAERGQHSKT